jgi:ABC-2 type transport system permease protein
MSKPGRMSKHVRFLMYLAVVVLLNLAGTTLFFRVDLTANKMFSLSEASRTAVGALSDPLTVKVFFTSQLPAPYNNIERSLRDLLAEYSVAGNRYFNYEFYDVSEGKGEEAERNREIARDYGIHSVQIQKFEQDEVRFQKAYMGMVLIHGDLIETIPAITSTEGLEYKITVKIRKMASEISALLGLEENVKVLLFLSSSLQAVGPYMNLTGLAEVPGKVESMVEKLNDSHYGKLTFSSLDPTRDEQAGEEAQIYNLLRLRWDAFQDRRGQQIPEGQGFAGLVVRHGDRVEGIRLIKVMKVPIFGTQYQLMDAAGLEQAIGEAVENVIQVNEEIGYLSSHGCLELGGPPIPGQQTQGSLANFHDLLREDYTVRRINLKEESIPEGLASLIIAGPKEEFTDYELYEIDQYLMKGRGLILFLDRFREVQTQDPNRRFRQQGPVYLPLDTGIEKLLTNYGLSSSTAYVMDENCFKQRVPERFGGGERPIYFAPIIKNESINKEMAVLKDIKGLVMLKASPLVVDEEKAKENGLKPVRLFSSSDQSWEMKGRIDLNPLLLRLPGPEEPRKASALAYVLEGGFPSYFADKPIPEKVAPSETGNEGDPEEEKGKGESEIDLSEILRAEATVKEGKPGGVFLVGTSEILQDNLIDREGKSPNAQFLMNVIDAFNGREAYALMRTKAQRFNPLRDIEPGTRTMIKSFNIAGLPVIVILVGGLVWLCRVSRKRMIQNMFGH